MKNVILLPFLPRIVNNFPVTGGLFPVVSLRSTTG